MYSNTFLCACWREGFSPCRPSSHLSVPKRLSPGALSQQSPLKSSQKSRKVHAESARIVLGMRRELSDAQWQLIEPHLPPKKRMGRPRADDRKTLEGILWVLRSGARWQDVPREYTPGTTCWRRLKEWEEAGVWETLWRAILSALETEQKLDWAQAFLDGSFVPAKKGALESD